MQGEESGSTGEEGHKKHSEAANAVSTNLYKSSEPFCASLRRTLYFVLRVFYYRLTPKEKVKDNYASFSFRRVSQ